LLDPTSEVARSVPPPPLGVDSTSAPSFLLFLANPFHWASLGVRGRRLRKLRLLAPPNSPVSCFSNYAGSQRMF
jgi:hypothetical protein